MDTKNLETFHYDNTSVRNFSIAVIFWGVVGMLVGLILAFQLVFPSLNLASFLSLDDCAPYTPMLLFLHL